MNLDELRSVQSKERQKDSLQNLRPSFYQEVGEYIAELEDERDRVADRADDPFSSPEVSRLTDEIETAKDVVEAIYERRMGKLVKQASLAAAGMPADDEGLTAEEADLFDDLVDRIGSNKSRVLDVLEGVDAAGTGTAGSGVEADPSARTEPDGEIESAPEPSAGVREEVDPGQGNAERSTTEPTSRPGAAANTPSGDSIDGPGPESGIEPEPGVDPTGPPGRTTEDETPPVPPEEPPGTVGSDAVDGESTDEADAGSADSSGVSPAEVMGSDGPAVENSPSTETSPEAPGSPTTAANDVGSDDPGSDSDGTTAVDETGDVDRVTVKITRDIGSILGVDDREYTLSSEDIVTLPEQNAEPLLEREAAEPLE